MLCWKLLLLDYIPIIVSQLTQVLVTLAQDRISKELRPRREGRMSLKFQVLEASIIAILRVSDFPQTLREWTLRLLMSIALL
jgi:hypothetical protein